MTAPGPLFRALEEYIQKNPARFHMPGHKGHLPFPLCEAAAFDLTEVLGTDSLYEADGPIAAMEREFSSLYGSKASFLSAGGSTLCIQAMLALATKPGDTVLCARGVHTAAVNAMALLDIAPVWLYPEAGTNGLFGEITAETVAAVLREHPEAAAVYITSPNYYGVISDVQGLASVCHAYGIPLLVDNAHGAHLKFLPQSMHPMDLGADLCADSLHKTLPVLTGGALLHVGNRKYVDSAKAKMSLFGSTSPSYLIMLSCDMVLAYLQDTIRPELVRVSGELGRLGKLALRRGFDLPVGRLDPIRLTLGFGAMGWSMEEFGAYIRGHGVEPEYLGERFCVFLGSTRTSQEDLNALELVVQSLPVKKSLSSVEALPPQPVAAMPLREAVFCESEALLVDQAIGRTASSLVAPCPPGIPIVVPGEKICPATAAALKSYGILQLNVVK